MPDFPVYPEIEEIMEGRDLEMNQALHLIAEHS